MNTQEEKWSVLPSVNKLLSRELGCCRLDFCCEDLKEAHIKLGFLQAMETDSVYNEEIKMAMDTLAYTYEILNKIQKEQQEYLQKH